MRIATSLLVLVIVGTRAASSPSAEPPGPAHPTDSEAAAFAGATMGTTYSVKVAGLSRQPPSRPDRREIQGHSDRVNGLMSTYDPDSELSRFNASDTDQWFPVSARRPRSSPKRSAWVISAAGRSM